MMKKTIIFLMILCILQIVQAQNYTDHDWDTYHKNYTKPNSTTNWTDDFSDQLEYIGANNTLKVEYSLKGIEGAINGKGCWSPNATLQDMYGKDIAYCFKINKSCIYNCVWADKNITSERINLVYRNMWVSPSEAMWWNEIEAIPKIDCNWWCKILNFFRLSKN